MEKRVKPLIANPRPVELCLDDIEEMARYFSSPNLKYETEDYILSNEKELNDLEEDEINYLKIEDNQSHLYLLPDRIELYFDNNNVETIDRFNRVNDILKKSAIYACQKKWTHPEYF